MDVEKAGLFIVGAGSPGARLEAGLERPGRKPDIYNLRRGNPVHFTRERGRLAARSFSAAPDRRPSVESRSAGVRGRGIEEGRTALVDDAASFSTGSRRHVENIGTLQ